MNNLISKYKVNFVVSCMQCTNRHLYLTSFNLRVIEKKSESFMDYMEVIHKKKLVPIFFLASTMPTRNTCWSIWKWRWAWNKVVNSVLINIGTWPELRKPWKLVKSKTNRLTNRSGEFVKSVIINMKVWINFIG